MRDHATRTARARSTETAAACSAEPPRLGRDLAELLTSIGSKVNRRDGLQPDHAERQARAARAERVNVFIASIGPRYKAATLAGFTCQHAGQREAVDRLRGYIDYWPTHNRDGSGILLVGPVGGGKSHLAVATAREIVGVHDIRARRVSGPRLFAEAREHMGRGELQWIGDYIYSPLLVLDDPTTPAGPLSDHQASTVMMLLDERGNRNRPTITTLNVATDEEAVKRLTAPVWDRVLDRAVLIRCEWPSYRRPYMEHHT